ncbi:MAG: zinc-binding dehydrogenase [Oscillospiraceae bacterium]|nr:zinc-binding dehydrogenase [Oscillospiraceae bacterium]
MKTKAVRLYGKRDLRLEEFELPAVGDGEILIRIVSDSVCMSTYKTAIQGEDHIRVPKNVAQHPAIIGHEFCAEVVEVGKRWQNDYKVGDKVVVPPVLSYLGTMDTIGYSFEHIGGDSTYSLVYEHIIENGFLIKFDSKDFFSASLVEPISCVVRGFKGTFHLDGEGNHITGLKEGGKVALLAACGPMGLAALDCALHGDWKPSMIVVTDLDQARLDRAKSIFDPEEAKKQGVGLIFANTADADELMALSGGTGYDDVFAYIAVPAVVELGDAILAFDGCLNFFSGPTKKDFYVPLNFYNVHYAQHHVAGTSGSTTEDMLDVVRYISEGRIAPAVMVSHIGGMDAVIDTTLRFPEMPGAKKLIYTHINLPLTAIADFAELGKTDARFSALHEIVSAHNGLWCAEAENYLLANF